QLRMGTRSQTVPLSELSQVWRGDFATFWRGPPGYAGKLAPGQSGPAADRLAAQLAISRGERPPAGPSVIDDQLSAQVAAFQRARGLQPDGVAGPVTFMQLNRATGVDEPRLQTEWAAR